MAAYREQQLTQAISGVAQLQDILAEIADVQELEATVTTLTDENASLKTELARVQDELNTLAFEHGRTVTRAAEAEAKATRLQVQITDGAKSKRTAKRTKADGKSGKVHSSDSDNG